MTRWTDSPLHGATVEIEPSQCSRNRLGYLCQHVLIAWGDIPICVSGREENDKANQAHYEVSRSATNPHDHTTNNSEEDRNLCDLTELVHRRIEVVFWMKNEIFRKWTLGETSAYLYHSGQVQCDCLGITHGLL